GGPSDAPAVTLTDTWPAGFSQGLVSPSQGTCSPIGAGPDFGCSLGTIPSGGSATVSVAWTVAASVSGGAQTETVSVASSAVDPLLADNTAADSTTVVETAVLVVTIDDGQAAVLAGTSGYAYTITVANSGPSDADTPSLAATVPAAFTAGVPSSDLSGDCSGSAGNAIACTLPASLGVGDTDATDVVASADLGVTVDDGLASVTAGDGLGHGYTITVTNGGPSDAPAVTLTDTWPAGFSQGLVSPSQGTCSPIGAGPDFSCS